MRINILQHTPDEGAGSILDWAKARGYEVYTYYPGFFNGVLPTADETDMLVLLGGPISPNDSDEFIGNERKLIQQMLDQNKPMFGACFGAQQITKTLGYPVGKSPVKEVGWAPVTLQSSVISGLPKELNVLHWHEEMFEIPAGANLLFSSKGLKNQGFEFHHKVVGLQFHLEPKLDNVREMVVNDFPYIQGSVLNESAEDILNTEISDENEKAMFEILDYINE